MVLSNHAANLSSLCTIEFFNFFWLENLIFLKLLLKNLFFKNVSPWHQVSAEFYRISTILEKYKIKLAPSLYGFGGSCKTFIDIILGILVQNQKICRKMYYCTSLTRMSLACYSSRDTWVRLLEMWFGFWIRQYFGRASGTSAWHSTLVLW